MGKILNRAQVVIKVLKGIAVTHLC